MLNHEGNAGLRWLLHIDDYARRLMLATLNGSLAALERTPVGSAEATSVTLARAVRIGGRTRSVAVTLDGSQLTMEFAGRMLPQRQCFHLLGPIVPDGTGSLSPRERMLATLGNWRTRLIEDATDERTASARRVESDLSTLLIGAVEATGTPWSLARLYPHATAGHSIHLQGEPFARPRSFRPGRHDAPRTITPELVAAIDAVLGQDVHVSEWHPRPPGDLPGIEIGFAPTTTIRSGIDAVTVMRAIAALPPGAGLVES